MIGLQLAIYMVLLFCIIYFSIKSVEWWKPKSYRSQSRKTYVNLATAKIAFLPTHFSSHTTNGFSFSSAENSLSEYEDERSKDFTYWVGRCNSFDPLNREDFSTFLIKLADKAHEFQGNNQMESSRILWMQYRQIYQQFHFKFVWDNAPKVNEQLDAYLVESLRCYSKPTLHPPNGYRSDSHISSEFTSQTQTQTQFQSQSQTQFQSQSQSRFQPNVQSSQVPMASSNFNANYFRLFQEMENALQNQQFEEYRQRVSRLKKFLHQEIQTTIFQANIEKQKEYEHLFTIHQLREDLIPFYEIIYQTRKTLNKVHEWVENGQYFSAYQQLPRFKEFYIAFQELNNIYVHSGANPMVKLLWDEFQSVKEDTTLISQLILKNRFAFSTKSTLEPDI